MPTKGKWGVALLVPALLAGVLAIAMPSSAAAKSGAQSRLDSVIQRALREGGPFFGADERAVIERKCGYAPGSWDGFDLNFSNGVLLCSNGRRVDDPEVRAVMAAAEPRIVRRVEAVMHRPEIAAAIEAVAHDASAEAMRALAVHRED